MKKKTFSILATLLFVAQGAWAQETETTPTWEGEGTSEYPYLIQSVDDWNELAERSKTNTYEGVYFRQKFTNETTWQDVTQMVGSNQDYPFGGIYDGGGYRLDFKHLDETVSTVAPFRYIKNATIKHLYLYCSDVRGGLHVSGLVGATVSGTNTIEDCRVGGLISSYGTHAGGFIGHGGGANNILRGCLFDGTIVSKYSVSATEQPNPTYAAPFIGWCEYTTDDRSTLQGCFEKGKYEGFDNTALYFVNGNDQTKGVVVYRTFHSQNWNDGHRGYTVTSGTDGLSLEYQFEAWYKNGYSGINCTDYATSGITYYGSPYATVDADITLVGIVYDNKLYLANGDRVNFYPKSESTDYKYTNFSTTSGSLETNDSYCSLTMGAANSVITASPYVILNNDEDNSSTLTHTNDMRGVTVRLYNRTLSKTGLWNTLCLPFELTVADSPLDGATIKTLDDASLSEDGTLTLNFSENSPTTIAAGTPFIVKWNNTESTEQEEDTELKNPKFSNVTISNTLNDVVINGVLTFKGIFSRLSIEEADNTKLYLGADGNNATLYYPNAKMAIGACRAYIQLANGITAGNKANAIRAFVLNFGDGEQTGIEDAAANSSLFTLHSSLQQWYTLDGRRLSGKPTQPGIYVESGKKVVIK